MAMTCGRACACRIRPRPWLIFCTGTRLPLINGVPGNVDPAQLRRAAESGDALAQLQLGICLYDGKHSVATNHAEAYKWMLVAVSKGQKDAKYWAREMELFFTPEELKEGRAAAAAYLSDRPARRN